MSWLRDQTCSSKFISPEEMAPHALGLDEQGTFLFGDFLALLRATAQVP